MTQHEHSQMVKDEAEGRLLIGVDRPTARQFFTETSHRAVQEAIGEPVYMERLVVMGSLIVGVLLAVASAGISIWAFSWWSVAVAPVSLFVWFVYYGTSSHGQAGISFGLLLVATATTLWYFSPLTTPVKLFCLAIAGALFFSRLTYITATGFLRALVIRNWRACDLLLDRGVTLRWLNPTAGQVSGQDA